MKLSELLEIADSSEFDPAYADAIKDTSEILSGHGDIEINGFSADDYAMEKFDDEDEEDDFFLKFGSCRILNSAVCRFKKFGY